MSLSVEPGELLGLIGPNGSGKTTLFNCVTGVLRPSRGHVLFKGEDITKLTATITELAPQEVWVTHGREEALVRWCSLNGIPARPLHMVGYEDEAE